MISDSQIYLALSISLFTGIIGIRLGSTLNQS